MYQRRGFVSLFIKITREITWTISKCSFYFSVDCIVIRLSSIYATLLRIFDTYNILQQISQKFNLLVAEI